MLRIKLNRIVLTLLVILIALISERPGPSLRDTGLVARAVVKDESTPRVIAKIISPAAIHEGSLQIYRRLKNANQLTAQQQREMDALLGDARVLRSMEPVLMRQPASASEVAEQRAAFSLVADALKTGNAEVATEVLRSVVTDGQLEEIHQDNLDRVDRAAHPLIPGIKNLT